MDTHEDSGLGVLILMGCRQEVPAVEKGKTVTVSRIFAGLTAGEEEEGIMLVAGSAPGASNGLCAISDRSSLISTLF